MAGVVVAAGPLHLPNQPLLTHVVVVASFEEVVVVVASVLSLQPNHPGVLQLLVLAEVNNVLVLAGTVIVVLSSRQPHQPGVLHVAVRVREKVDVGAAVVVVDGLVCVPFSNFQRKQSAQLTSSSTHVATLSYTW
jgi:hypothetical protein